DRQALDGLHCGIPELLRITQKIQQHVKGVLSPEQLLADHKRRHSEDTARDGPIGILTQPLLDDRIANRGLRISDAQLTRQIGDHSGIRDVAPVEEDRVKDRLYYAPVCARRDYESQSGERIEGMCRRK